MQLASKPDYSVSSCAKEDHGWDYLLKDGRAEREATPSSLVEVPLSSEWCVGQFRFDLLHNLPLCFRQLSIEPYCDKPDG